MSVKLSVVSVPWGLIVISCVELYMTLLVVLVMFSVMFMFLVVFCVLAMIVVMLMLVSVVSRPVVGVSCILACMSFIFVAWS